MYRWHTADQNVVDNIRNDYGSAVAAWGDLAIAEAWSDFSLSADYPDHDKFLEFIVNHPKLTDSASPVQMIVRPYAYDVRPIDNGEHDCWYELPPDFTEETIGTYLADAVTVAANARDYAKIENTITYRVQFKR